MGNNINTQPMPGFMELLPNQQIAFNKMLDKINEVYKLYGFRPIETPILERAEVLLTKSGGETEKQIYQFQKGDNNIAMRFDLTVPLARYVAQYQNDLVFPFKIGNIGKVYRGEKPQAGRFREFYQCDADIIGRDELDISFDAEIISLMYTILTGLGFDKFKIKINNRKVMSGFFQSLDMDSPADILRILDKLDRLKREDIVFELKELKIDDEKIDKIFEFIETKDDIIEKLKEFDIQNEIYWQGVEELEYVDNRVKDLSIDEENYEIDLGLSRGLDYYTGTVYETFLTDYPEFGSIYSGGRYDNLSSYYTDNRFPGVGCSIGLTRLFDCLLKENQIDTTQQTSTNVLIVGMEGFDTYALELGNRLRGFGINTEVLFQLKGSFKYADRLNIPYVVVIGEDEIESSKYTLKEMASGEQVMLEQEELIAKLRGNI
ncbi:MAG: histidine--tRNA ligase [Candidatus Dojkabacteria bacterium]|jgi:histidyl-tRNA synthetase|nr:histidine--tRNA ligase [Candidatus Dojkabacteria bacterium]MDD2270055.1 histidine--tRNA ligase [Candidatus Dojkabacteria bacterium]